MNDHTPSKAPRTPALGDSSGWHLVPYTYDSAGDAHPRETEETLWQNWHRRVAQAHVDAGRLNWSAFDAYESWRAVRR